MKVFQVDFEVDSFRSLIAKHHDDIESRTFALDGTSRQEIWDRPVEVEYDNVTAPIPDIFSCGIGNMLLHGKSNDILTPLLSDVAEMLPVVWESNSGVLVNIVGFVDCLDQKKTVWNMSLDEKERLNIKEYEFLIDKIPRTTPFKLSEQRFKIFCSHDGNDEKSFYSIVHEYELSGLHFEKIWEA